MSKIIDLTGNKYGRLTVIKRGENDKDGKAKWLCECECGVKKEFRRSNLKSGCSKSCGNCSKNRWEVKDDYILGYTQKGEEFYIDKEDYKEVSKYTWFMDSKGYLVTANIRGKVTKLHRFIMKAKKGDFVDHKNNNPQNNRKSELRICTNQENSRNRKGVKGYSFDKRMKKYRASILFNYKTTQLGSYTTEDEARLAYCTKAIELFGEFVHEDVVKDYEILNKKLNKSQDNT